MSGYGKRIWYLALGQVVSAVGIVGMIQANIGLDPWNVLHMGIANVTHIPLGTATIVVGAAAILIAGVLGERFGFGTVANVIAPGILINVLQEFHVIPLMHSVWSGLIMMVISQALLAVGTYYYLASAMGAGPRDALMVAVSKRIHLPVGACRSILEVLAVILGWLMGGKVGVGTLFSALTIGAFLQAAFALFHYDAKACRHETMGETLRAFSGRQKTV